MLLACRGCRGLQVSRNRNRSQGNECWHGLIPWGCVGLVAGVTGGGDCLISLDIYKYKTIYVVVDLLWQGSTYIAITNRTFSVGTVFHALVKQLLLTSPFKRSKPEYFTMIFVILKFFSLWSLHIVSLAINDLQCFSNSSLTLLSKRFSLVLSSLLLPLSTSTACTSASAI